MRSETKKEILWVWKKMKKLSRIPKIPFLMLKKAWSDVYFSDLSDVLGEFLCFSYVEPWIFF